LLQIDGCENSGLFKAFSQHVLHRLNINQKPNGNKKIRITFLSRNTKYRNVLNENELLTALKNHSQYEVKKVFFIKQMHYTFYGLIKMVFRLFIVATT